MGQVKGTPTYTTQQQAYINKYGASDHSNRAKGTTPVRISEDTTIESYLDDVNSDGFAKDTDLIDGSINAVFDTVRAANNGNGTNFKVGDDAWIGDENKSNTAILSGVQNRNVGYLQFGSGSNKPSIGFGNDGSFPAIGSSQAITGSLLIKSNHLYFFNGGASNNGWTQVI